MINILRKCIFVVVLLSIASCAHKNIVQPNIAWVDYDEYQKHNRDQPVFVEITANDCADCQYVNKKLLKTQKFADFLVKNNMIAVRATLNGQNMERIEKWLFDVFDLSFVPYPKAPTYILIIQDRWLTLHENVLDYIQ